MGLRQAGTSSERGPVHGGLGESWPGAVWALQGAHQHPGLYSLDASSPSFQWPQPNTFPAGATCPLGGTMP